MAYGKANEINGFNNYDSNAVVLISLFVNHFRHLNLKEN